MKKQIVSFAAVFILVIFSITACIPDDNKNSNSKDSSANQETSIAESTKGESNEFEFDSEYGKIVSQLDELEKVLDSLDVFSEDDLEIPEP